MKIYIKNISGETITLDNVKPETSIGAVILRTWMNRAKSQKNVTLRDFFKAINLIYAGKTLKKEDTLLMLEIKEGSTIKIVGKSWTMTPNFDWSTMKIYDQISGKQIQEPYMISSAEVIERPIERPRLQLIAKQSPTFDQFEMNCRSYHDKIASSHLTRLSITKSFSSQKHNAAALSMKNDDLKDLHLVMRLHK